MRKCLFGLLTTLVFCLIFLPGTAEAADLPSLLIQDTMVTSDNMADVLGDGTVSTAYENGKWAIRLTDAALTGPISVNYTSDGSNAVDAEIILSGENTVTVSRDYAYGISASGNLTISGEGSLTVTSMGADAAGIGVEGNLVISGVKVSSTAQFTAIYGSTTKIQGSQVTAASTTGLALLGHNGLEISDSNVEVSSDFSMGVNTRADIRISGQSVIIGTNSSYSLCAMGSIFISGAAVDMTSTDEIAVYAANQLSITGGADVTVRGGEGGLVVGAIGSVTGGGSLLVDGAKLHSTAKTGPGVMVDGRAAIQGGADVTAKGEGSTAGFGKPGYGLYAQNLVIDGSKVSTFGMTQSGIYVGTRGTPAEGNMTVKGGSWVTARGDVYCGITVEGTFSIEEGIVASQSRLDLGIDVGDTLVVLKGGIVESASSEYRGIHVGKLLDIRNGAGFRALHSGPGKEAAVLVKSADGIKLGSLCVEESGGTPGAATISQGGNPIDVTVFLDESGVQLQEVIITTDSADYTGVDAAIVQIPGDLSAYTSESVAALNRAKNAVNWELPSTQQDTVDGYARSILAAIAGLTRKPVTPPAPKTCTVRFLDGDTELSSVTVRQGNKATPPEDPAREGYRFDGWHTDAEGTKPFDFETAVTADLTLYAKWTALAPSQPDTPSGGGSSGGGSSRRVSLSYAVTVEKPEHGKVASSRSRAESGDAVTLTVSPDGGYELASLTVAGSRGNAVKLTEKGGGKYAFTMPAGSVKVRAVFAPLGCGGGAGCPSRAFSDLNTGAWYHEAVDFALEQGLMNGYGDGTFRPDGGLSRGMLAQILYNKAGRPAAAGSVFPDVAEGHRYAAAIAWAAEQGVVDGYGDGRFGPGGSVTREQLAVMLWRYAGNPAAGAAPDFRDADEAGNYALEALSWAAESGVISGYGDGRLAPKEVVTRAQAAQMLKNYLENV